MCSVCGIVTDEPDPANVERVLEMLRRTRHRGPDSCGLSVGPVALHADDPDGLGAEAEARLASPTVSPDAADAALPDGGGDATRHAGAPRIVLGHARLTITGTGEGRQPFVSDDGQLALAHNGEVYNHEEVAALLDDPALVSGSDSEALCRVLQHHLSACGDLAEAVERTVDMVGGMYAFAVTDGETLVLARDPVGKKPIYHVRRGGTFAFASERKALVPLAREGGAPIRRLLPGEVLVHEPGVPVRVKQREAIEAPAVDIRDMDEAIARYEDALDAAMERRTRGLERAAVFFSGGVDSAMVARLLQRKGVDVTGYVCGMEGSSDVRYAREVAEEMGLPLDVTIIDEDDVEAWLPRILEATELHGPMMTEVAIPMWFAAKAAHEDGHRVVFTGQGADEQWAGYDWYRGVVARDGHLTLHARLWEDVRALPVDCLEREDRVTMAWHMEMRAPFLDPDVLRTSMRVSPKLKLEGPEDDVAKHPHRILAHRVGVPRDVAFRLKEPAQDGASIHDLLEAVAERRFPGEAPETDVPDFGSNYRYRDKPGHYGSKKVRALLATTVQEGGFVVAGEDASAHAPPYEDLVREPPAITPT